MADQVFILAFDTDDQSMSKENGLRLDLLGELLVGLGKVLNLSKNKESVVINNVFEGSYGVEIQAPGFMDFLKEMHNEIKESETVNPRNRAYIKPFKKILENGVSIKAREKGGEWARDYEAYTPVSTKSYYYEVEEYIGLITKIGNNTLGEPPHVRLSSFHHDILITPEQDITLAGLYKKNRISALVKVQRNTETHLIKKAELMTFDTLPMLNFKEIMNEIGDKFPYIEDSVAAVREIRAEFKVRSSLH